MKMSKSQLWTRPNRESDFVETKKPQQWPDEVAAEIHFSSDGMRLYFSGESGTGGQGKKDIWIVRRIPRTPDRAVTP